MVQLNTWSLLGHHGAEAADLAAGFVQRDDPFVLASDAWPECATRTSQSLLEHGFPVLAAAAAA
jgi:hypothetical protein